MSQQQRITPGSRATTVTLRDGLRVTYHETVVVAVTLAGVRLDSGGWRTSTTKTRMNQASNEYGLGYQVYAKDRQWFVDYQGRTLQFYDGMVL